MALWFISKKGCPKRLATNNPNSKAIGGETKVVAQITSKATKISCCPIACILKKVNDAFWIPFWCVSNVNFLKYYNTKVNR